MKLTFRCSACDEPQRVEVDAAVNHQCAACGQPTTLQPTVEAGRPTQCACCGCPELYRQKDFPQSLGLALLTIACLLFFVFAIRYEYAIAWSVLLGSAAVDGLVYLIVGDVVICYRCGAKHRGVPSKSFSPFELTIAEKYRQERLRREELAANRRS